MRALAGRAIFFDCSRRRGTRTALTRPREHKTTCTGHKHRGLRGQGQGGKRRGGYDRSITSEPKLSLECSTKFGPVLHSMISKKGYKRPKSPAKNV